MTKEETFMNNSKERAEYERAWNEYVSDDDKDYELNYELNLYEIHNIFFKN